MPERDGYIPGVPCWVDTSQPDPEAALPFYSGLFGWEFEDVMPEGSEAKYFMARIGGKEALPAFGETNVFCDLKDPGAHAVQVPKAVEAFKGLHQGFLRDLLEVHARRRAGRHGSQRQRR